MKRYKHARRFRLLALVLIIIMTFALAACGDKEGGFSPLGPGGLIPNNPSGNHPEQNETLPAQTDAPIETEHQTEPAQTEKQTEPVETEKQTEPVETEKQTETPAQTEPAKPLIEGKAINDAITSITASSSLVEGDLTHSPERMLDGNLSTAWSEGVNGSGIGQSVIVVFSETVHIQYLVISAGYHKSDDLYHFNARPHTISLRFSDESVETIELKDVMEEQTFYLGDKNTTFVQLTIDTIYPGTKWSDTCITELGFE